MKIIIGGTTYTKIKELSFAPQTDVVGSQIPINNFYADIMTDDNISTGGMAQLVDDNNTLWAKYWLTKVERKDKETLYVEAVSFIELLDRSEMAAEYYNAESFGNIVDDIFASITTRISGNIYQVDSSIASETITGFAPVQSARERLLWACFVVGAYVRTTFTDVVDILPIDSSYEIIPISKTFWKPKITYNDYVTEVRAVAYSYTQGTPQATDEWVQVGNTYYIQTKQEFNLTNPDAPNDAQENVVKIEGLTLINSNNVSDILTRISTYYFKRIQLEGEIINNAEYEPGAKVIINADEDTLISGYIYEASFTFGNQAKSQIKLVQTDEVEGGKLTIIGLYGDREIHRQSYLLPTGYNYSIENPFIDIMISGTRFIFYPLDEYATGTIVAGGVTDEEDYEVALRLESRKLYIYSVDELEQDDDVLEVT